MQELVDNVKRYRELNGISIRELSRRTGLSASALSQLENGKSIPSITAVKKIADALNTTVGIIIGEEKSEADIKIVKEGERKSLENFGYGLTLEFLTTIDKHHQIEPTIQVLEKKAVSGRPPYQHEGDEFLFVLEGSIKLVYGNLDFFIEKGDSVYFNPSIPHSFTNIGDSIAKVLFVTSPPYF